MSYSDQLHAAQVACDFEAACRVLKTMFSSTQAQLVRESTRYKRYYNPDFWPECALRAERAATIHAAYQEAYRKKAILRATQQMREEDLDEYAEALESGNYAALGF